jgi:RNA polymerase sigma-70 factor (ECF subfamily)
MTSPAATDTMEVETRWQAPDAGTGPESEGWVTWLLSHLPERERQVVACIDVVGLDVASTAAALGMNATAVRVARHRGLRRLRSLGAGVSP